MHAFEGWHMCPARGAVGARSPYISAWLQGHARSASSKTDSSWTFLSCVDYLISLHHRGSTWQGIQAWYVLTTLPMPYRWVALEFCMWKLHRFKLFPSCCGLEVACCHTCTVCHMRLGWERGSGLSSNPSPSSEGFPGLLAGMGGTSRLNTKSQELTWGLLSD